MAGDSHTYCAHDCQVVVTYPARWTALWVSVSEFRRLDVKLFHDVRDVQEDVQISDLQYVEDVREVQVSYYSMFRMFES